MTFLEHIKQLCKQNGVTVSKMEKDIGISKGGVYKWNTSAPSQQVLVKLSQYFGVSIDSLLDCGTPSATFGGKLSETDSGSVYYLDPETAQLAQELYQRPEMKVLFDASRKATKEDIEAVAELLKKLSR